MSQCEPRGYYPAPTGLFKLRVSDGDLVWDCRPVVIGGTSLDAINRCIYKLGDRLAVSGIKNQDTPAAMFLTDDGEGVSDVVVTPASDPPITNLVSGIVQVFSSGDGDGGDYYYSSTFRKISSSNNFYLQVAQFDLASGALVDEFQSGPWTGPAGGATNTHRSFNPTLRCYSTTHIDFNGLIGTRRYETNMSGTVVDSHNLFANRDPSYRHISDGTYYYGGSSNGALGLKSVSKTRISDLTDITLSSDASVYPWRGNARGGVLAYSAWTNTLLARPETWIARDTSALSIHWSDATTFDGLFGVDCCSAFVVAAGYENSANTAALSIIRKDVGGSVIWNVPITASAAAASLQTDYQATVLISSDESKVYVFGGLLRNGLAMSLFCLDADDGSTLWSFAAPDAGISVLDDGDYLYLGTSSGTSPNYR